MNHAVNAISEVLIYTTAQYKGYCFMRLYQKHPKPISQEPSRYLVRYLSRIQIPPYPVLDLACGYGRNGAYIAQKNHHVIFADLDEDCLDFVSQGKGVAEHGEIPQDCTEIINIDLTETWPFMRDSLGGIICVHFYYPNIVTRCINTIVSGGFFYFETVNATSGNYLSLPFKGEIINQVSRDFNVLLFRERIVKQIMPAKSSCVLFAIKR